MDVKQIRTITSPVQQTTEEQRIAIRPMVEQALLTLGAEPEDIALINYPNAIYNSTLLLGHLPGQITMSGAGIVVTDISKVLTNYHLDVIAEYGRTFNEHLPRFMWMTWGEEWWDGLPFNVVREDRDYLEYLRYALSTRNEQVRGFVKRRRGRPKTGRTTSGRVDNPAYRQWLSDCAAYRAQVDAQATALVQLEQHTKERIQSLKAELAERIQAQKDILQDARTALAALRAQGAPKLDN